MQDDPDVRRGEFELLPDLVTIETFYLPQQKYLPDPFGQFLQAFLDRTEKLFLLQRLFARGSPEERSRFDTPVFRFIEKGRQLPFVAEVHGYGVNTLSSAESIHELVPQDSGQPCPWRTSPLESLDSFGRCKKSLLNQFLGQFG